MFDKLFQLCVGLIPNVLKYHLHWYKYQSVYWPAKINSNFIASGTAIKSVNWGSKYFNKSSTEGRKKNYTMLHKTSTIFFSNILGGEMHSWMPSLFLWSILTRSLLLAVFARAVLIFVSDSAHCKWKGRLVIYFLCFFIISSWVHYHL